MGSLPGKRGDTTSGCPPGHSGPRGTLWLSIRRNFPADNENGVRQGVNSAKIIVQHTPPGRKYDHPVQLDLDPPYGKDPEKNPFASHLPIPQRESSYSATQRDQQIHTAIGKRKPAN
jgi:hypothetical protein